MILMNQRIAHLTQQMNERFNGIDNRLDGIDNRLDGIDNRLDGIDNRLNGIDNRLNGIDNRLNGMDERNNEILETLQDFVAQNQGISVEDKNLLFRKFNKDCAFDEPLHHILNEQGISSPIFPMTKVELNGLTVSSLRELLGFYGLSTLG